MKKTHTLEIAPNHEYLNIFILNEICFFQRKTDFGKITEGKISIIKSFDYRYELFFLANRFFYLEDYEKEIGYFYDTLRSNFLKIIDFTSFEVRRASSNLILYTNRQFPQSTLFDIKENKIIWSQNRFIFFSIFDNELFLHKEKNRVLRYNSTTGNLLWQYDLPERYFNFMSRVYISNHEEKKAEIQRIIGVHNGVLWVVLNSARVLGLDTTTGALVHNIGQPNKFPKRKDLAPDDEYLKYGTYLQIDEAKGVLFGLRWHYYFEIDLSNPSETFVLYDISSTCKEWKIEADMPIFEWSWEGNNIYYGQNFADANNLGVFNRSKREITWAMRIEEPDGISHNFRKLEYASGRIYVLDNANKLHIFEEDSVNDV